MHVVVIDPSSGEVFMQRELSDDEILDCDVYANEYADQCGMDIDWSDGYIPNCCGDFRVELREDPENSVHIWNGQSYYFKGE
jgi:hypothetical protein